MSSFFTFVGAADRRSDLVLELSVRVVLDVMNCEAPFFKAVSISIIKSPKVAFKLNGGWGKVLKVRVFFPCVPAINQFSSVFRVSATMRLAFGRAVQTRARLLPALKVAFGRSKHGHVCCPP